MGKKNEYIAIPSLLKVEKGALNNIGKYLNDNGLNKVVIYFGNGLIDMFGSVVMQSLHSAGVEVIEYQELDTVNLDDITKLAFAHPNQTQAIVGIGGGKVIDAAKYSGYLRRLPFVSVPTSSSSDGFASSSASLIIDGHRSSVPARMAYGIIVDADIIRSAPEKFLYSGIGDMVSKVTATFDWEYEESKGAAKVNDCSMMIAQKAVNSFIRTPFDSIHDDMFLDELLDSLAISGIANEIAGSSAPTSGSEHLISHALDKKSQAPQLHGIQVGIATYIMSIVQNNRVDEIREFLSKTGFFGYVEGLDLSIDDYINAIDEAPSVKPFRHTYLHEEVYRNRAKEILTSDSILKKIFKA